MSGRVVVAVGIGNDKVKRQGQDGKNTSWQAIRMRHWEIQPVLTAPVFGKVPVWHWPPWRHGLGMHGLAAGGSTSQSSPLQSSMHWHSACLGATASVSKTKATDHDEMHLQAAPRIKAADKALSRVVANSRHREGDDDAVAAVQARVRVARTGGSRRRRRGAAATAGGVGAGGGDDVAGRARETCDAVRVAQRAASGMAAWASPPLGSGTHRRCTRRRPR